MKTKKRHIEAKLFLKAPNIQVDARDGRKIRLMYCSSTRVNTKGYNFLSAERCVGKMKIVMQRVFQGWKVVPPYHTCVYVLAESNVS